MMMHFLKIDPVHQLPKRTVVCGFKLKHKNFVALSKWSNRVDTVWLPPLPVSLGIPGKPHAGLNEQCAGEGIFLTQHRDS